LMSRAQRCRFLRAFKGLQSLRVKGRRQVEYQVPTKINFD
jgi:hypothetical protein